MKNVGIMLDCSRDAVRTPETIKTIADIMSRLGFDTLLLYTEDTYAIDGEPYFGYLRGRYSAEEIKDIDSYCASRGIELVPCIQTLAHLNGIAQWKCYAPIIDCNDILLVGDEQTYELIDDMLKSVSSMYSSKKIHIGMDEAWMLGAGHYMRKNGSRPQKDIMREHLKRVLEITDRYGFEPMIWSDMLFQMSIGENTTDNPDVIDDDIRSVLPDDITLMYWDYYSHDKSHYDSMMKAHRNFKRPFVFAGGLWTWGGFAPNNTFSIEAAKAALASCRENDVNGILLTLWGDDGAEASPFSVLPSMYYASCLLKGIDDETAIKSGFEKEFGISFDDFMLLDVPLVTADAQKSGSPVDPDKYMLYNDPFIGIFDSIADEADGQKYGETARLLERPSQDEHFGYIFRTIQALCGVLEIKNDIGIRTRNAYRNKDTEQLKALVTDYKEIEKRLKLFSECFTEQWEKENKPFGIEIHETRIGGLMLRVGSCTRRLEKYLNGELDRLEELEEDILDPECNAEAGKRKILAKTWHDYFANVM